jgi:1-acyl-sn-glycerol-3-phosphate acyltransferase
LPPTILSPPRPDNYLVPLPRKDRYDPQGRLWPILRSFLLLYRALFVGRVHIEGLDRLPDTPVILVSNHAFVSDAFILALVVGRLQALAQAESFLLPFFGGLLARSAQIPVIRGEREKVLARAADQLARGRHVLIYPEGELSHGGDLRIGRTGAADLARRTGSAIVPVGFFVPDRYGHGFQSQHYDRPTFGVWQIGGPCFVVFGDPWRPFSGRASASFDELRRATDELMSRIEISLDRARSLAGR